MTVHNTEGACSGRVTVWCCLTCGFQMWVYEGEEPIIIDRGDPDALHRGGMGGLMMEEVVIEPVPDVWSEWAEQVNLPEALDSDGDD